MLEELKLKELCVGLVYPTLVVSSPPFSTFKSLASLVTAGLDCVFGVFRVQRRGGGKIKQLESPTAENP